MVVGLMEQAETIAPIDLAISNAGNNMPGDYLEMEAGYFDQCYRVGLFGGFLFSREALLWREHRASARRRGSCQNWFPAPRRRANNDRAHRSVGQLFKKFPVVGVDA